MMDENKFLREKIDQARGSQTILWEIPRVANLLECYNYHQHITQIIEEKMKQ
jgi:hypothetical protein